jgi:hypothetical protein
MHEVIHIDFRMLWRVPVLVRGAGGQVCAIRGPEAALRNLNETDVSYESTLHRVAKQSCLAAIVHSASCGAARDAFVDACFETGALV